MHRTTGLRRYSNGARLFFAGVRALGAVILGAGCDATFLGDQPEDSSPLTSLVTVSGCPEGQEVDLGATVTITFSPWTDIRGLSVESRETTNAVVTQNTNRTLEWDITAVSPGEVVASFSVTGVTAIGWLARSFVCTFTAVANTPTLPETAATILVRFDAALEVVLAARLVGINVKNSARVEQVAPAVPRAAQEINQTGSARKELSAQTVAQTLGNTDFPCGEGEFGVTVCPADGFGTSPAEGEWLFIFGVFDAAIPLDDPERFHQYAFVFDRNANVVDNFGAAEAFHNDYFQGTDLWYSAEYSPQSGWRLAVTDAALSRQTQIPSAARIIINDNVMLLAAPASEFPTSNPPYRVTAFCHDGGFGLDGGFWSGDLEPKVGEALQAFD